MFIMTFTEESNDLPPAERRPNIEVLRKKFNPRQMSVVWMRLKQARGREDMTIKSAWGTLTKPPVGAQAQKRNILSNSSHHRLVHGRHDC